MQAFEIYAAAAGGLFALIVILQLLRCLRGWIHEGFSPLLLKFLVYPFFLRRHQILGPRTRLSILVQIFYWAATVFCALYKTSSMADVNVRLGNLSLINAVPLYATIHLSALADALSMSLTAFRGLHGSVGLMTGALTAAHVGVSINLKGDGSTQSLPRTFGYAVSKRAFCASHTYSCTGRLLRSAVATPLCSATAPPFLRSLPPVPSRAGGILPIRGMAPHSEYQTANTAMDIPLRGSVGHLGNATSVTNNLSQSFNISGQRKSEHYQVATEEDHEQLQRQGSVLHRRYSCSLLGVTGWAIRQSMDAVLQLSFPVSKPPLHDRLLDRRDLFIFVLSGGSARWSYSQTFRARL